MPRSRTGPFNALMFGALTLPPVVLLSCLPALAHSPLPRSAAAYVTKRDQCDHWRGEDPYDAARASEINAKVRKLCTGTDSELAKLRRRYHANKRVMAALRHYETSVE